MHLAVWMVGVQIEATHLIEDLLLPVAAMSALETDPQCQSLPCRPLAIAAKASRLHCNRRAASNPVQQDAVHESHYCCTRIGQPLRLALSSRLKS